MRDLRLLPTRYDRVRSWIVAAIALSAVVNGGLFILWLSTIQSRPESKTSPTIRTVKYGSGGLEGGGMARPEMGELSEVISDAKFSEELLRMVTDQASQVSVTSPHPKSIVTGSGDDSGNGPGDGDGRPPGDDIVPPWVRWHLQFDATSRAEYARQLDYFGIELAAIGGVSQVDYAHGFSSGKPERRQGNPGDEKRVYMTWKKGDLQRFDEQLLQQAGIQSSGRILLHFLPDELCDTLLSLEQQHTDRPAEEWLSTMFALRRTKDGYEWVVVEQTFR